MLDDQTVTYSLAAVGVLIVGVTLFNARMAKREQEAGPKEEGPSRHDYLVKFARHEGNVVGESVATEGDHLILKQAGVFKSVPLAAATIVGDEIVLAGDIDWPAAIEAGNVWHAANTKGVDPEITEHLTRSQDVRNPALAALKDREGDDGDSEVEGEDDASDDSEE